MSDVKDRLLRREAKRILGARTASVVGELRTNLIEVGNSVSDLTGLLATQSRGLSNVSNRVGAHDGRLGSLEFWQDKLRQSFWTRLKYLFTGRVM